MDNTELQVLAFFSILVSLFLSFLIIKIELHSLERNLEKFKNSITAANEAASRKSKPTPTKKQQTAKAIKRVVRPTKKGKQNG